MAAASGPDEGMVEVWTYRIDLKEEPAVNLAGYKVEATDGEIGTIDEATYETGGSYIVVDTGSWIFGKKVMLPAGVITEIDADAEVVFVDRSKQEIKGAPEFHDTSYQGEEYRAGLGSYYAKPTTPHEAEIERDRIKRTG